jgi:SAM-dependent methyltransferase
MQWTPNELQRLRLIIDRIALDLFHPHDLVVAGSGRGELAFELARRFPHSRIVGVESRRADISAARAQAASSALERRVEFVEDGLGVMPLPSGRFGGLVHDTILFPSRIPVKVDPSEIARVLKPGGVTVVAQLVRAQTYRNFTSALDDVGLTEVYVDDLTPLVRPIWEARAAAETDPARRARYSVFLDRECGLGGRFFYAYVRANKPRVPAVRRDPVALSI